MDYSPLAQKVHSSYTNFSLALAPTTATRSDGIQPFLLLLGGGRQGGEAEDVEATNSISSRKQKQMCQGDIDFLQMVNSKGPRNIFPNILHQVLSDPALSDVIEWLPHGRSWSVPDSSAFVERVSKIYFSQSKFDSFKRQVSAWGFRRKREGPDQGSYYHELFLRGMPHLVQHMERTKQRARCYTRTTGMHPKSRNVGGTGDPDLFAISTTYPVPLFQDATERREQQVQEHDQKAHKEDGKWDATAAAAGTFAPRSTNPIATAAAAAIPLSYLAQKSAICPNQRTQPHLQRNLCVPIECGHVRLQATCTRVGGKRSPSHDHQEVRTEWQYVAAGMAECGGTTVPAALPPNCMYSEPATYGLRRKYGWGSDQVDNEDGGDGKGGIFDDADEGDDDKGGIFDDAPEDGAVPVVMPAVSPSVSSSCKGRRVPSRPPGLIYPSAPWGGHRAIPRALGTITTGRGMGPPRTKTI